MVVVWKTSHVKMEMNKLQVGQTLNVCIAFNISFCLSISKYFSVEGVIIIIIIIISICVSHFRLHGLYPCVVCVTVCNDSRLCIQLWQPSSMVSMVSKVSCINGLGYVSVCVCLPQGCSNNRLRFSNLS